jgi:hypothetical protein
LRERSHFNYRFFVIPQHNFPKPSLNGGIGHGYFQKNNVRFDESIELYLCRRTHNFQLYGKSRMLAASPLDGSMASQTLSKYSVFIFCQPLK